MRPTPTAPVDERTSQPSAFLRIRSALHAAAGLVRNGTYGPSTPAGKAGLGRRLRVSGLAFIVLYAALGASSAHASKGVVGFFGNPTASTSVLGGQFSTASSGVGGTAVNNGTGNVYVADRGNNRIEEFDASGNFLRAWGQDVITNTGAPANSNGTGFEICDTTTVPANAPADCKAAITSAQTGGAMNAPQTVAVSQSDGSVYVVDQGNRRVQKFDSTGHFLLTFGQDVIIATGPPPYSNGTGFEVCDTTAVIPNAASDCKSGITGTTGGAFAGTFAGGIAVAPASAPNGGDVLVTDPGSSRVQEFTSAGAFVRAFGWAVVKSGGAGENFQTFNEQQTVRLSGAFGFETGTGGTFTLTFNGQTTAPIAYNASAAVVDAALEGRSNIGSGNVAVTGPDGGTWTVEFTGTLAGTNVTQMTGDGSGLTTSNGTAGSATVTTTVSGGPSPVFEICSVITDCQAGSTGAGTGQFAASQPSRIGIDGNGLIYTVESATANFRVQQFTPAGSSLTPAVFASPTLTGTASLPPVDIAVDPVTNHVYVAKAFAADNTTNCTTGSTATAERRVLELDATGALQDTHMTCAGINSVNGLAINASPSSRRLYVSSTTNAQRVYMLDAVIAPSASMDDPSAVTEHTATLSGTANANGGVDTTYRFEYRLAGSTTWIPSLADVNIGQGAGDVGVSQPLAGLKADSSYQVRLVATKTFGGPATASAPRTLSTPAVAPEVTISTPSYSSTTIRLRGTVNPNGLPSTYRFDYGTDATYGQSVPAGPEAPIGSTGTAVAVAQLLVGLTPGATYHYRLVATNAEGTTASADQAFTTLTTHPDARAFEMVSPPFKQGFDATSGISNPAKVSPDGNTAFFYSRGAFSDPTNNSGSQVNPYLGQRGHTDWGSHQTYPPTTMVKVASSVTDASLDLSTIVNCGGVGGNNDGASAIGIACALRHPDGSWSSSPVYQTVDGLPTGIPTDNTGQLGESADLSHVVFQLANGPLHLLPSDTSTFIGGGGGSVYELAGFGTASPVLRLVNVDNSGHLIGPASLAKLGGASQGSPCSTTSSGSSTSAYQAISADGSTIYFTACPTVNGAAQVYARVDGSTTTAVSNPSPSECTTCSATVQSALFQGASSDGSKAFFTTAQQLTDADTDTTTDLYSYDFNKPAGQRITQLSAGGPGDPTPGTGANVQGVLRTSSDGAEVYFVATGVLTTLPNGPGQTATAGSKNLYAYDTASRQVQFVGVLAAGDSALWAARTTQRPAQTTLDGRYLIFATTAALTADDTDTAADVYRYDAQTGELTRISIGEPSFSGSGNGNTAGASATIGGPSYSTSLPWGAQADANDYQRAISDDGSDIVFSTPERLQASDTNSASDVYEWHDGVVSMVSDGQDPAGINPTSVAMSATGSDVFFSTHTQLVGQDTDTQADVYDARRGGGLSAQDQPPVNPCSGDACQAAPAPTPFLASGASGALWPAPALAAPAPAFSVAAVSAKARRALARTGKVTLTVKASDAGALRAVATATLGKATKTVASAAAILRTAGTVHLKLTLSKASRSALASKHKLTVKVAVTYSKSPTVRRATLKLTHPNTKKKQPHSPAKPKLQQRAAPIRTGGRS